MARKVPTVDFDDDELAAIADALVGVGRGQSIEWLIQKFEIPRREAERLHHRAWQARGRRNHTRRSDVGKERFKAERERQRASPASQRAPQAAPDQQPSFPGGRSAKRPDGDYVTFRRVPDKSTKLRLQNEGYEAQPGGLTYRRPAGKATHRPP